MCDTDISLQVISPKLLKVHDHKHDETRVFLSEERNDNMIECIVSKVKIIHLNPNVSAFIFMHEFFILAPCYFSCLLGIFLMCFFS